MNDFSILFVKELHKFKKYSKQLELNTQNINYTLKLYKKLFKLINCIFDELQNSKLQNHQDIDIKNKILKMKKKISCIQQSIYSNINTFLLI